MNKPTRKSFPLRTLAYLCARPEFLRIRYLRCPYCHKDVNWGAITCPGCQAQISYGCKVPVTGCLLTIVIAFLAASVLIALLATKDPAGNITISHQAVGAVCALSILMGWGLWLLLKRIARTFVSFSRRRADPFTNQNS